MMISILHDNLLLGVSPWWSSALTSDLGLRCAVIAGVGAFIFAATVRALWLMPRTAAVPWRQRLRGESGTATVEFVLVFVPALMVCLILLQTVLAFSGNLFVHYAAYCATRLAIVEAPAAERDANGNIQLAPDDPTMRHAKRAAAFALAPVSGKLDASGGQPAAFTAGLQDYFDAYGQDSPRWVASIAAQRLAYALSRTTVQIYETRLFNGGVGLVRLTEAELDRLTLGPKDPLTLGVSHRLHLSIPYAAAVFANGQQDTAGGRTSYTRVTATSTMTVEGVDRRLPPQPTLEREP